MFAMAMSLNIASAFANDAADNEDAVIAIEEQEVVAVAEDDSASE